MILNEKKKRLGLSPNVIFIGFISYLTDVSSVLIISIMLIMFNIVYALFSMPAGILSDKLGRRKVIVTGWIIYALVYLFDLIRFPQKAGRGLPDASFHGRSDSHLTSRWNHFAGAAFSG